MNGRYHARVKFGGKEASLGEFDTPLEAAKAYDLEQLRRYASKAMLNVPHLRWGWVCGLEVLGMGYACMQVGWAARSWLRAVSAVAVKLAFCAAESSMVPTIRPQPLYSWKPL